MCDIAKKSRGPLRQCRGPPQRHGVSRIKIERIETSCL
nr:MAG TPA: hypothetical protein [Caudoviricetes sp.]DAQ65556.1 MAG TPA: hypothetical protein [Caudoviricetes sp.]